MKKILLIGVLALLFGNTDICAQSWLKKLGDKANKAKEAIEKVGNSSLLNKGKESDNSVLNKASNGLNSINNKLGYADSEFFSPMPKPEIAEVADITSSKLELPAKFTPGETLPEGLTYYRMLNDLLAKMPSKDSIAAFWADSTGYYVKGAQCVRDFREELLKLKKQIEAKDAKNMARLEEVSAETAANALINSLTGGYQAQLNSSLNQAGAALQKLEENQDLLENGLYNMTKLGEYYGVDPMTEEGAKTIDEKFNKLSEAEQMAISKKLGLKHVDPSRFKGQEETDSFNSTGLTEDEMAVLSSDVNPLAEFGVRTLPSINSDAYTQELKMEKRFEEFKALYGEMLYNANKTVEEQYKENDDHQVFVGNINTVHEQKRKSCQARYEFFKNTMVPERYEQIMNQWAKSNENIPSEVLGNRRRIVNAKFTAATTKQDKKDEIELWSQMEVGRGAELIGTIIEFIEGVPTGIINGLWLNINFFDKKEYQKVYVGGKG